MNRRLTIAATTFAVLLALGACGRKGELEPPPGVSPDMAAKTPGCTATPSAQQPIDAAAATAAESGNPNRMPTMTNPSC